MSLNTGFNSLIDHKNQFYKKKFHTIDPCQHYKDFMHFGPPKIMGYTIK